MAAIVRRLDRATDAMSPRKLGFELIKQVERDRRRSLHGSDTLFNTDVLKGRAKRVLRRSAHAEAILWCAVDACQDDRRLIWPEVHDESI